MHKHLEQQDGKLDQHGFDESPVGRDVTVDVHHRVRTDALKDLSVWKIIQIFR